MNRLTPRVLIGMLAAGGIAGLTASSFFMPDSSPVLCSLIGVSIGTLLFCLVQSLVPHFRFRNPYYVMEGQEMTGHESNRMQAYGRSTLYKLLSFQLVGLIAFRFLVRADILIDVATAGTLIAFPISAIATRQRCPFCSATLISQGQVDYFGEFCARCGRSFCDLTEPEHRPHRDSAAKATSPRSHHARSG